MLKILKIFCLLLIAHAAIAQDKTSISTHTSIELETNAIFSNLVEIRRGFHANPELAGKEIHTKNSIAQYLRGLGLEVLTNTYGNSVIGILKGEKKGKNIAWRTEMDALPSDFADKADFKSKVKGVEHGCGHDIHMAIALGMAEVLAKNKKELHGTVYFIFQPEEETFVGAKKLANSNWFNEAKLEEIYALHVTPLPVGQIMVKPRELFAYQKRIRIKLKDEVSKAQAKELSQKIYNLLARAKTGSKPWEIQNISDPKIGLAKSNTIFEDYLILDENFTSYVKNGELFLEAYLYETNSANLKHIIPKIKQLIAASNYKDQLLSISFIQENPTVFNDEKLTNTAIKTLNQLYGNGTVTISHGQVPYFNDDFCYFQQKTPGVYFFLGGSNMEQGLIAMNHAPNFAVDETCIKTGVKSFSSLIFERLLKLK